MQKKEYSIQLKIQTLLFNLVLRTLVTREGVAKLVP